MSGFYCAKEAQYYRQVIRTCGEVILPGQQMILMPTGSSVTTDVDVSSYISWRQNTFTFKDLYVKEALGLMSRWYGVT